MHRSAVLVLMLLLAACGGSDEVAAVESVPDTPLMCADVENVEITAEPDGTFRFDVTVRSVETGWDKYADAWEVRAPDGTVLGTRILAHPHVDEQPFTRSLRGVVIPAGVTQVEVAARDLVEGFCGIEMTLPVPHP
jgi:hypothetical protein